jgi:hypothetical protein
VLSNLELQGSYTFTIEVIDADKDGSLLHPELTQLWSWGFEFGLAQSPEHGAPGITVLPPDGGGAITPNRVIQAAQQHIERKHDELLAAGADERHLFIWVDGLDTITMQAMEPEREHRPSRIPKLGPGIDTLWIATRAWKPGVIVWRLTPPSPWVVDVLPDAIWQQPRDSDDCP